MTRRAVELRPTHPARPFLTARWSNLALVTYAAPREALLPHLPPGCVLDERDGSPHVSLVAFDFMDTRVRNIAWPGYTNFSEINLRFYVRCGEDRGVVFIREYVPKRAICWIARFVYNEPYHRAEMTSRVETEAETRTVKHTLRMGGRVNSLRVVGGLPGVIPSESSAEHYFKEHRWGFGTNRRGARTRYEVVHPVWRVFPVLESALNWDFAAVYGEAWGILNTLAPISIILAEGSAVEVRPNWRA